MMAASSFNARSKPLMAVAIVAMVVACAFSASAQTEPAADPIVLGPDPTNPGQGDVFSCTGGPPFTVPAPPGTCAFVNFGPQPAGLVCDIPTTVFFLSRPGRSEPAFVCHTPAAATPPPVVTPAATLPPTPPQPTCPPASIETADEPQIGDAVLSSGAQNSGDYAQQVTPIAQNGGTGNLVNSPSVLQTCSSTSGAIEPGGISKEMNPSLDASSPSTINQPSSSE